MDDPRPRSFLAAHLQAGPSTSSLAAAWPHGTSAPLRPCKLTGVPVQALGRGTAPAPRDSTLQASRAAWRGLRPRAQLVDAQVCLPAAHLHLLSPQPSALDSARPWACKLHQASVWWPASDLALPVQEAGAAAEATIQTLRAELADSHRAENAAQEASWQASSDLSQARSWTQAHKTMHVWCLSASLPAACSVLSPARANT